MKLYPNNVTNLILSLPSTQSVLIRGPHGIGKSQIAKQVGTELDRPVIDLRLSQMTEGDFLGLPKIEDEVRDKDGNIIRHGMTQFRPPWWFVKAMTEPVVLLLDEINRAVPEVMQCAFQLVLDRAIQGKSIHPETIVIAAVNASNHYQINEMDPALLDRFLTVDMVPSIGPWKEWARDARLHSMIIDFCTQHTNHWWHDPRHGLEPDKVYPTPRSWEMLNRALQHANLFDDISNAVFRHMAVGLIGDEAGMAFYEFAKNYKRNITAEDILNRYSTIQDRIKSGMSNEQLMSLSDKLINHCRDNEWDEKQVKNLRKFMIDMKSGELLFALWNRINGLASEGKGKERKRRNNNSLLVHRICNKEIKKAVTQGDIAT